MWSACSLCCFLEDVSPCAVNLRYLHLIFMWHLICFLPVCFALFSNLLRSPIWLFSHICSVWSFLLCKKRGYFRIFSLLVWPFAVSNNLLWPCSYGLMRWYKKFDLLQIKSFDPDLLSYLFIFRMLTQEWSINLSFWTFQVHFTCKLPWHVDMVMTRKRVLPRRCSCISLLVLLHWSGLHIYIVPDCAVMCFVVLSASILHWRVCN